MALEFRGLSYNDAPQYHKLLGLPNIEMAVPIKASTVHPLPLGAADQTSL